jgi:hypothetical protein
MKIKLTGCLTLLFLASFGALSVQAQVRLRNAREIRQFYGLNAFASSQIRNMKIAILDNDFEGFLQDRNSLPESTLYIPGPLPGARNSETPGHGLLMAQIVWGLIQNGSNSTAPQFYLMQSNGLSNLRAAISKAIELKVDMILYAASWETGGNFDGEGFINAEVTRATQAGIAWINAAGNYRGQVYTGDLRVDPSTGLVRTPGPNNTFSFSVKYTNTPVKLTLSWNDFKNIEETQTHKDLDWELKDWKGNLVPLKNFKQGPKSRCGNEATYARGNREDSLHPREQDTINLSEGLYYLKIIDCSGNFLGGDRLRLSIQNSKGDAVNFQQAQNQMEIMPPADNVNVITVGDLSPISSLGPTVDGRIKPNFLMPLSRVEMSDGRTLPGGSSTAAAIFAGVYAVLWGENTQLRSSMLLKTFQNRLMREQGIPPYNSIRGPQWRTPSPNEYRSLFY